MCTANIDMEAGICNGSQGIVVDFVQVAMTKSPLDEGAANPNADAAVPDSVTTDVIPLVRFANGLVRRMGVFHRQSEDYPTIVVSQIPLRLAWALTIHKIQGATLDMADIDIGKSVFECGQSYVALSRVKSLDGLYLSNFDPAKITVNPLVTEFYASFSRLSTEEMASIVSARFSKPSPSPSPASGMDAGLDAILGDVESNTSSVKRVLFNNYTKKSVRKFK
jgi:hypothetical protein